MERQKYEVNASMKRHANFEGLRFTEVRMPIKRVDLNPNQHQPSMVKRILRQTMPEYYIPFSHLQSEYALREFDVPTRTHGIALNIIYDFIRKDGKGDISCPDESDKPTAIRGALIRAYLFPSEKTKEGIKERAVLPHILRRGGHPWHFGDQTRAYEALLENMLLNNDLRKEASKRYNEDPDGGIICNEEATRGVGLRAMLYNPTRQRVREAAQEFGRLVSIIEQNKEHLAGAAQITMRAAELDAAAKEQKKDSEVHKKMIETADTMFDYASRVLDTIGRPTTTLNNYLLRTGK